jgi:uncharacterized membrane protein (UPF0127 family)
MEQPKYCVYNQTCECFLSLGVTVADSPSTRIKGMIGRRTLRSDQDYWVVRPKDNHALGVFSSRDLVYLDKDHRVIHVVESFPASRIARLKTDAASVLALPVHTIYSSQTQPGNQLVICVAEEMEFRLRSTSNLEPPDEMGCFAPEMENTHSPKHWLPKRLSVDRRRANRQQWPRLIAYDWTGATLVVNGIKDISSTGLYLLTEKFWPLGTMVMLTLQRTDEVDENSEHSITVQLRVTRWAADGIGLVFVQPEVQGSTLMGILGDDKVDKKLWIDSLTAAPAEHG